MKRILILLSLLTLLISCTKKEEQKLKTVKLTKLYTIEGYPEGADSTRTFSLYSKGVKVDDEGNVFVRDNRSGSIRVFDSNGKFKNNITNKGMGPEEVEFMSAFYLENDSVCVLDSRIRLKKFFKDGKYIYTKFIEYDEISSPLEIIELNDSTLLMRKFKRKIIDDIVMLGESLDLYSKSFSKISSINEAYIDYLNEREKLFFTEPLFAFNDSIIFFTIKSKSEYEINKYSYAGVHIGKIKKNYIKKRFTEDELDKILGKGTRPENYKEIYEYKVAINAMMCDRNGYLWTLIEGYYYGDMVFDIFDNDKLIAICVLENPSKEKHEKVIYLKDKFYLIDYDNDIIEVYDYEIK